MKEKYEHGFEISIIATPFLAVTYAYPSIIDIQFGLGPPPPAPEERLKEVKWFNDSGLDIS